MQKPCTSRYGVFSFPVLLIVILLFFIPSGQGHAGEKKSVFPLGEQISYTIRWEMIRAGKAMFKVLPFTDINGEKAWHFILDLKSNRYIDMLYKIRDRHEGFTAVDFSRSFLYKKTQSGKDRKEVVVQFDWKAKTATYSNFGGKHDPVSIPLKTVDPLSAFYKMRTLDFKKGVTLSFPVTDGKKYFIQEGMVMKKEKITLPSGTFDTYLMLLKVNHFSGVFKKSDNPTVKLWVTADDRKIPVRIKIKVLIGSIIFDLISIK